jgi:hypothetical protein
MFALGVSTLDYIDLAPSGSDEEHSSQSLPHDVVGYIIDLTEIDLEGEHTPIEEDLEGMEEEDFEEHRVVEDSIASARREEEEVHHAVKNLFKYHSHQLSFIADDWLKAHVSKCTFCT